MARINEINGRSVLPGDEICVIEEFMPGFGTYVRGGNIYAALPGMVRVDLVTRTVHVAPKVVPPAVPERNSIVIGIVQVVKDEFAIVKIIKDIKGNKYPSGFTGLLHISRATDTFVKNLYEVVRVGDIVKTKVLNDNPPYDLTLREPSLGVVVGFCGECGTIMKKAGPKTLKCPICGRTEKRKLAHDYGNIKGLTA
ncbi:MAG TPA: RNA-binding protein [Candidatus Bathyarchaeota archaeon]|nr:RNA-binding protein [Candidatus Bathyarchaeota archaeon]